MTEENKEKETNKISNTLFFTSLKDSTFDYTIPLKLSFNRFCKENRGEASKNLFEYLCYKIINKEINNKGINEQIAIISEKFLSSKDCIINLSKLNYTQKKFILIPICHSVTHKWNAIIFVHLERQILQYINKTSTEPIVAKIISSNVNSEEDDYLLNTTMDKIENAFNFTSPEDIQFEVDSINICDQPNTSIFLLNFIEGLVSQENNTDIIMNYIMKLYDESSNTNSIGSNNYFVSFNKENEIFKDLISNYINEIKIYAKNNGIDIDNNSNDNNSNIFDKINFRKEEEDEFESEEEAYKIVAKDNEEALKQMEEQELFFTNNMNVPFNMNMEDINNMPQRTILGLIQEVENESDEDTEQKENNNNNSLIKKDDININSDEEEEIDKLEITNKTEEKNENSENNKENEDKIIISKSNEKNKKEDKLIDKEENKKINEQKSNEGIQKEIKKSENNGINQGKINSNNRNILQNYRNIKSEKTINENMSKLNNNLDKIKNEIINNLSKENKTLRGSFNQRNNTFEKLKIATELNNEDILSKSLTNNKENKNENNNAYNVINLQRNQKYNNSSFYVSKGESAKSNNKNSKKEENEILTNVNNNTNYLEDKSNIIKNKKINSKNINNIIENINNNIIYESNFNKIKDINKNIINNINNNNIKNIKNAKEKPDVKTNIEITQKNQNIIKSNNNIKNNCNKGKNTIIINETSNNNTVINFIEIKNNFESNNKNNNSDYENNIPEDGVTNKITETFSPNKTLSRMKKENLNIDFLINKNKTYKGKSTIDISINGTKPKDMKLTLLSNYLYGTDFLNSDKNNNDNNLSANQFNHFNLDDEENEESLKENEREINLKYKNKNNNNNLNENNIPKRTIKKLKYRGGPEKTKYIKNEDNIDLLKEFQANNNCTLNMSNDLNCGCTGMDNGCFIF